MMDIHAQAGGFGPQARYIVPSFTEKTSYGIKEMNPYNKMFEDRIIFLGSPVDDTSANDIMSQLIVLEGNDPDRDIIMYINSPGGSLTALMAIYDTMQYVRPDIQTVCMGQAASAAAVLLAAGTPGKRTALPNSRVIVHQPATEGTFGQASDMEISLRQTLEVKKDLYNILAKHSNQKYDKIEKDADRDYWMRAIEAKEYGLIDEVLEKKKA